MSDEEAERWLLEFEARGFAERKGELWRPSERALRLYIGEGLA